MNTVVDPFETGGVATVETVVVKGDIPATITTTLYDLIAAVRAAVEPDDDALVIATVVHILRSRRVTFLDHVEEPDRWNQELSQEHLSMPGCYPAAITP